MKAIDHKFLTGTFLQGITIRRVFYPVPDINLRLTIKFTVRKVIVTVINLNDFKVRKKSLGHKLHVVVSVKCYSIVNSLFSVVSPPFST